MKKQIIVVCGVLFHNGKVLMAERYEPEQPEAHLKWEFPGGKVDFGETIEAAVIREFREETGCEVAVTTLLPITQTNYWEYEWGIQQTLCFVYLCKLIREHTPPKDHHIAKIAWIPLEEVKELSSLPGTNEVIEIVRKTIIT
jgi:mutator protein MutT